MKRIYLHGVFDSKASNGVPANKAVRDGEAGERVIPPEGWGSGAADETCELPGGLEGTEEHIPVGGDGGPEAADASGAGEIGEGNEVEDGADDVSA